MIRFLLLSTFFIFLSCTTTKKETSKTKPQLKKNELPKSEYKFVNAPSGLNYRSEPKGNILGKFENNFQVNVVKHTAIFENLKDGKKQLTGEWVAVNFKNDTVYVFDAFLSSYKTNTLIWNKFPLKKTPLIDTTNFDNLSKKNLLTQNEISKLQLKKIYPNIKKEGSSYSFIPGYSLKTNNNFKTIIIHVFKGEDKLETILTTYQLDNKLINYKLISYDEMEESWARVSSTIRNNCITTINPLYTELPVIDTILHHINRLGYINKVNTNFKNNIRPNKSIKLNKVYTDTIQFIGYNDDYDYGYLEGKKNNKDVYLNYSWNGGDNYNFKKDDFIQITWKMDSIYIAGDGETLQFAETAIHAVKIN